MDILDKTYNERLTAALLGRRLRPDAMPRAHRGRPMFSFWGEELGFSGGDVHQTRAYRIYLDYNKNLEITGVDVVVEGELISPCSGYFPEALDAFDWEVVTTDSARTDEVSVETLADMCVSLDRKSTRLNSSH